MNNNIRIISGTFLFLMGFSLWACRVNPSFSKLTEKEKAALQPLTIPAATLAQGQAHLLYNAKQSVVDSLKIYRIDTAWLTNYIQNRQNELTCVYIYATFCKPCVAEFPQSIRLIEEQKNIDLLLITPESWLKLPTIRRFLFSNRVNFPTYILDLDQYGDEYSVQNRYKKFVAEIYPGHPEILGLPTYFILNKQNKVLYASTGAGKLTKTVLDSLMVR